MSNSPHSFHATHLEMYTHEILIECGVSLHSHNDVAIFKTSEVEARRLRAGKSVGSGLHNDQSRNIEVGCKFSLGGGGGGGGGNVTLQHSHLFF